MNTIKPTHISLEFNEFKHLSPVSPERLILKGTMGDGWLTISNDPNDYFVTEGTVLEIPEYQSGILLQSLSQKFEVEVFQDSANFSITA